MRLPGADGLNIPPFLESFRMNEPGACIRRKEPHNGRVSIHARGHNARSFFRKPSASI